METDKRPFYNWIMVLLINIGTIIFLVSNAISEGGTSLSNSLFQMWNFITLGISIFVSVVPILISRSNGRLKNRFGYGIPILLLLPLPYFVYDYYTCTGKFCQLGPLVFGWAFGLSAIIFAIFYTIGIYSKKWSPKFVLFLSFIIPILIVGGLWLLIKH